ncbi:hypothetical protein A0J61_04163 [Choanephora cucurbitarum]|uniref:Uncharacterized protein n=1 Tax=Choanephora cucurbitarum TaxID=101091 RepID=A0A1C7NFC2_9FUNG|nr:hypothetical protein A0J61_04163 [Choanephora cucurbitarum]
MTMFQKDKSNLTSLLDTLGKSTFNTTSLLICSAGEHAQDKEPNQSLDDDFLNGEQDNSTKA